VARKPFSSCTAWKRFAGHIKVPDGPHVARWPDVAQAWCKPLMKLTPDFFRSSFEDNMNVNPRFFSRTVFFTFVKYVFRNSTFFHHNQVETLWQGRIREGWNAILHNLYQESGQQGYPTMFCLFFKYLLFSISVNSMVRDAYYINLAKCIAKRKK